MAYVDISKWTPPRKSGRIPWVSTGFRQSVVENEQADAGRDGRIRLARPNYYARTGTGKYLFFRFSWPQAGLATLPGWSILCLSYVMTIHTYTYIVIHSTCNSSMYLTPVAFTYITCNCIIDTTSTLRLLLSIKYVYQFLWPVVRSRPPISMNCNVVWIRCYHARLLGR